MGYPVTQGGVLVDAWRIPIEEAESAGGKLAPLS